MRARWVRAVVLSALVLAHGTSACGDGRTGGSTPSSSSSSYHGASSASSAPAPPASATGPDITCRANGCLRAVTHVGDYARETLAAVVPASIAVDNGYSIDTLEFVTSGATARATVAVPIGVATPAGGFHVVANNHGTTGLDDPCAVAGTLAGAGLAGTFGAHGLIGVATDYPGLGTPGLHPYLVAESEGRAALDALRALQAFARLRGIALSRRFAIVGLSQGGHATIAAAARHRDYAPELDIRAFAASGPASAWEEHWRVGARYDGELDAVHAMLVYAWASHYGFRGPELWSERVRPLVDAAMHESCMFADDGRPTLTQRLGTTMAGIFAPAFLEAYRSGVWGPYADFARYFADNRVAPYAQTAPLVIYQGDRDDVVPEAATREVVSALTRGGVRVDYRVVPGGHHTDVAFGFLSSPQLRMSEAIAWLRAELDAGR